MAIRRSAAGEDHEAAGAVGHRFAKRHGLAEKRAAVQRDGTRAGALDRALAGHDEQPRALRTAEAVVAARRWLGVGNVERSAERVPRRLGVGDRHPPRDVGVVRGELAHRTAGRVKAVDAKARRLTRHGAVGVLEAVRRARKRSRHLRPEVHPVRAVAHPADPKRRMDRDTGDPVVVAATAPSRYQAWQRHQCRGGGAPLEERTAGRELHAATL